MHPSHPSIHPYIPSQSLLPGTALLPPSALGHVAAGAYSADDTDLLGERGDLVGLDDQIRVLHSSYLHALLALSSTRRTQMRLVTAGSRRHEPSACAPSPHEKIEAGS